MVRQAHDEALGPGGQPALVGTITIERSEKLSSMLKRSGIKHVVLNAKYHEKEAEIVAQAGRKGQVTIATNMAGRGTDILLGGNPEFLARDLLRKRDIDPAQATPAQWNEAISKVKPDIDREHEEVFLSTPDGEKINGLFFSAPSDKVILYAER